MIRTLTLSSNRRSNCHMMEGVLMSKSPMTHDTHRHHHHSSLQSWQCDQQESSDYDNGSVGNLLNAQVAAVSRLASSSADSGHDSDHHLPPELHSLEAGNNLLSNDVSSANPTANFLQPKTSIWGTGDSEYSWAQESLSRSSAGSMDDSSLLSTDTARMMETSKASDSLVSHWPLSNSQSSPVSIQTAAAPQAVFQRRSWQSTSDDDHMSLGLLTPTINMQQAYNHSFPSLSSSSSGLDASKFSMDTYLGERSMDSSFEATSVYDSMARKIHNQMSGMDGSTNTVGATVSDMSSMGYSTLHMVQSPPGGGLTESSDNNNSVSSGGLFPHGLMHKSNYTPMDQDKNYLTSNSRLFYNHNSSSSTLDADTIVSTTSSSIPASNQRFGENINNPKLSLESLSGNSLLNISPSESVLGSHNYLYSTQKKVDPLESLRKWPTNAAATPGTGNGTGLKDFSGNNSALSNVGRFSYSSTIGDNDEGPGLYDSSSWPASSVGHQSISAGLVPGDDSRKRFLHMSLGQPSDNTSHKRLHLETQNGQTVAMPPASLKRSSSWASSLTSTGSKGQDAIIPGSGQPYTKSNSRHAVGPALNTNLKPRARQGSANDPQSIAARHRRERISERLKVLQDLVPNGSKVDLVTMLEKAINYVKFLQLQVKVLTTDDYWPSNEKGAAPCTALPNFEDMEGALKVLVAQAEKEANALTNGHDDNSGTKSLDKSPEREDSGSPLSSDSM